MTVSLLSPPGPDLTVSEVAHRRDFAALAEDWNRLVADTADEVFHRHEFLHLWLQTFARGAELKVLTARDASGRLTAALPLLRKRGKVYGVPVRELAPAANTHSCRFDLLALDPERAAAAFLDHLGRDDGWDLLRIIDFPDNGNGPWLLRAALAAGYPAGLWQSQRSPYLDLPRTAAELDRQLSGQLRNTVRRRRRKLAEHGAVTCERFARGDLRGALEECFRLERGTWKGRIGTACAQEPATLEFYTRLAGLAARRGWLALYRLQLDGRAVAFQLGLEYGGTFSLLKLGYDEGLSECSPGLVLQDEVVRDCLARGLARCDFLGGDELWKRRWSNGVRVHHWLFVFRDDLRGRLLRRAKFDWAPVAKRWLRRRPADAP